MHRYVTSYLWCYSELEWLERSEVSLMRVNVTGKRGKLLLFLEVNFGMGDCFKG